jgi:restriction system protein
LIRDVKGEPVAAPAATTAHPAQTAPAKILNVQMAASAAAAPACPKCGSAMVIRTARKGANAGNQFWGCPKYPACKGILNVN